MRKEIDEVLTKHNGKLSYDALQDMTYMGAVINGKDNFFNFYTLKQETFNSFITTLIFIGKLVLAPLITVH